MKTKLTTREKVLTLSMIVAIGVMLSLLIGRRPIQQTLLTMLVMYCISGRRPSILWATSHTIKRDLL